MEQLKFYISNIDSNLLRSIGGRPRQLINLVQSGGFTDEAALAEVLFEGKWTRQNYWNLKARTKKILEAYFLMNPPKKGNKTMQKMQECRRAYLLAMNFVEQSRRKEAQKLLLQAYTTGVEFGFTSLAYNSVVELLAGASMEGKISKFDYYRRKSDELLRDLQAEHFAQQAFYKIVIHVNKKRGVTKDFYTKNIEKLKEFSCDSTRFIQFYYMICTMRNINNTNYSALIKNAEEALKELRSRKGVYGSILQFFTKNAALANTAMGKYGKAEKLLLESASHAPLYSYNLGIIYYYRAINFLHSGDYKAAYGLYRQHRKSKFDILSEQWAVVGAYMYFLRKTGRLESSSDRFSVGKYLNETVQCIHDKVGNNINVLIGELLVYLVKNRGKFIDRLEAVNSYNYNYLKGKDTRRAKWFLRILCLLPRADFHPVALKRIAKRQFDNLKNCPVSMGDNLSIEIIPFQSLLEIILEQIQIKAA